MRAHRALAWLLALIWLPGTQALPAQEASAAGSYLFLSSEPFGARISVDGKATGLSTPALLRPAAGPYTILLERPDHDAVLLPVEVPVEGDRVHAFLPPRYVTVETPEESETSQAILPLGQYSVDRLQAGIVATPRYPNEPLLFSLRILVPVSIGIGAGMGAWSYLAPPESSDTAIVPAVAVQVIASGLAAAAVALEIDRSNDLSAWKPPEAPYFPRAAERLRDEAAELLEQGDIPAATESYRELRITHPDAPSVPEALYTEARVAALNRESERAQELFTQLIMDYPVIEYYDRSLVQLARLAAAAGEGRTVEHYLSLITYTDPTVTRDGITQLRALLHPE